jgi:hypothetical protein
MFILREPKQEPPREERLLSRLRPWHDSPQTYRYRNALRPGSLKPVKRSGESTVTP